MDPVHRGAGADHWVQAEDGVLRVLGGEPVDHVDLGADRERGGLGGGCNGLPDEVGGTGGIGGVNHLHGALGVHDHIDAGEIGAGLLDLGRR